MSDFVDRYSLLITANAGGATSVVKGFGTATQAELSKTEAAAARVGQNAGTLFGKQFSSEAILGLSAIQASVGALGLGNFAEAGIEQAVKFNRANVELAEQIRATGDLAGTSVGGVDALANSIEKSQVIYSGTVKQGAALLLTFQEIRNQQGAGNNVFDRTLTVSAAVANVFNKDITTAVLQVGRALENPQAGIQALSRSGLTLEAQDRARILALAKQGDLLGAQKALLDALEARTLKAGAAAAQSDPLQRFGVDLTKFKVAIGQDLLGPAKVGLTIIEDIQHAFEELPGPVRVGTEALLAFGLVGAPLIKIASVLGTLKSLKIAADASAATSAAAAMESEAAATTHAAAATTVLSAELSGFDAKAAVAAGSSTRLSASLATIGAEGSGGLAAVDVELAAVTEGSFAAADAIAVAAGQLQFLGVESAGIATAGGQFLLFGADVGVAGVALSGLADELLAPTSPAAVLVAELGAMNDELSGLSVGAINAATGMGGVTESIVGLDAAAAAAKVPLGVDSVALAEIAANAGLARGEIALLAATMAEASGALGTLAVELETDGLLIDAMAAEEAALTAETGLLSAAMSELAVQLAFIKGAAAGALASIGGIGGVFAAVAAGFATYTISYNVLEHLIGGHHTPFADLSQDAGKLKQDIKDLQGNTVQKGFGLDPAIHQDKKDIADLVAGFTQLADTKGPRAALDALNELEQKFIDAGGNATQFAQYLSPVYDHLHDLYLAEREASKATGDLGHDFHQLVAGGIDIREGEFAVADAFDAVDAAAKKVSEDYANMHGTGDLAIAAAKGVADAQQGIVDAADNVAAAQTHLDDAYRRLTDAQDSVTSSTHRLEEAQRALDDYNSARGVLERNLALDIIQRRVVTTPAEEDQKRLDLLKNEDDNRNKQQSLQDNLTSAQHSYQQALQGVADAQRGITDAQKGLTDSTRKATEAEDKLRDAIHKRDQVSRDAAASYEADKRKLGEAIDTALGKIDDLTSKTDVSNSKIVAWGDKLKDVADKYAPGSDLDKNIDDLYGKLLGYQAASIALAAQEARDNHVFPDASGRDRGRALRGYDPQFLTPEQIAFLHKAGVPGFANGGRVPGLRGAPQLVIAHGGEEISTEAQQRGRGGGPLVHQENHFHGTDTVADDLTWANAQLAFHVARTGRGN